MATLLDVHALPRGKQSRTRRLRDSFLSGWKAAHPGGAVVSLDLATGFADLPVFDEWDIQAKLEMMFGEGKVDGEAAKRWTALTLLTDQLHAADTIVLSCPMWNFSVPWTVKRWIDAVVQGRLTFEVKDGQYLGLLHGRKGVVLATRDGTYAEGTPMSAMDFQIPYLKAIFGFLGLSPVETVVAEGLIQLGKTGAAAEVERAMVRAEKLGRSL
jgi:FMN-dependent NADH-azoreductase